MSQNFVRALEPGRSELAEGGAQRRTAAAIRSLRQRKTVLMDQPPHDVVAPECIVRESTRRTEAKNIERRLAGLKRANLH